MEVHGNENEIKIDSDMQNSTNDFSVQVNS